MLSLNTSLSTTNNNSTYSLTSTPTTTIYTAPNADLSYTIAIAVPCCLACLILVAIIATVVHLCRKRIQFETGSCLTCSTDTSGDHHQHGEMPMNVFAITVNPPVSGPPDRRSIRYALRETDADYIKVLKHMEANGGLQWIKNIIEIGKIENDLLKSQYETAKQNLYLQGNPPGVLNEQELYHGTSKDSLNNIYSGGFNRNYKGKNATRYGDGTYFARNFSYSASDTYSPPDEHGIKYVFLCDVLTGYYTQGRRGMKEPPLRNDKEIRFDSVVDRMPSPTMFVIFRDFHVFPSFIISFTK